MNDVNTLAAGDTIILVNTGDAIAMGGTQTTEPRMAVCVNALDDTTLMADDNIQNVVLRQTTNGYWAFQVGDCYLTGGNSGTKLVATSKPTTNAMATVYEVLEIKQDVLIRENADVDFDSIITILDVMAIVKIILNSNE